MALIIQNSEEQVLETIIYDKVHVIELNFSLDKTDKATTHMVLRYCLYGINSVGKKIFKKDSQSISIDDIDQFIIDSEDPVQPLEFFNNIKALVKYMIETQTALGQGTLI